MGKQVRFPGMSSRFIIVFALLILGTSALAIQPAAAKLPGGGSGPNASVNAGLAARDPVPGRFPVAHANAPEPVKPGGAPLMLEAGPPALVLDMDKPGVSPAGGGDGSKGVGCGRWTC